MGIKRFKELVTGWSSIYLQDLSMNLVQIKKQGGVRAFMMKDSTSYLQVYKAVLRGPHGLVIYPEDYSADYMK